MGESGVNLPLSVGDSPVMGGNVMVLVDELDKEDASLLEATDIKTFVSKNVSCQTDFDTFGCSSIPLLFCGMFISECEATTQCDIPKKVNVGISTATSNTSGWTERNNNSFDRDPIKISVPMFKPSNDKSPSSDASSELKKNDLSLKEEIVFKPLGTNAPLIVPPAPFVKSERNIEENVSVRVATRGSSDGLPKGGRTNNPGTSLKELSLSAEKRKLNNFDSSPRDDFNDSDEEADYWNDPLKMVTSSDKRQKTAMVYSSNIDEDPQLKAVEECLQNMKREPEEEVVVQAPAKVPRKTRMNLLRSVLQQNISLESEEEWITDDEVDDDPEDISEHLEQSMKDDGQRTCKQCNLTFNSHLLLIEHTESNHVANICSYCGFTTTFKNKLDRHIVKHTKEKAFICDMCGKQYSQKQNLRDHISRYHSEEDSSGRYPYSCEHCKRMYRNASNLIKHQETPGGKCNTCGEEVPCSGVLFRHKKNHATCSCEYCDKVFQSRSALQIHVNIKHKDKGLQCSMCPKKFLFPSYLKLHFANAHSQSTPQFKCQECGFCAVTEAYLKSHMTRMHSGRNKRKYLCQVCHKTFRSNARLVEHTRIHTGERPFACPVCFKTFYSQSNLYSHERTVHGRLNNYGSKDVTIDDTSVMKKVFSSCYQCQSCSATFNNKKKMKAHMETEHNICTDVEKTTFEEMVSDMTDIEVAPMQFEMDSGTVVRSEEYLENDKSDGAAINPASDENLGSRSALSLPAYVVPPNVNLVEIDGVQYHVIRSNT